MKRKLTHKHKESRISFDYKMTIHALYNFLVTVVLLAGVRLHIECVQRIYMQSNTSNTNVTNKGLKITS